jgi:F-type H+-transporting ATPase subunit b
MESIISTFHIDWKVMIAQVLNLGIVVCVLWFVALKPLVRTMLERTKTIEHGLAEARRIADEATHSDAERTRLLQEARQQAQQLIQEAEQAAATRRAELLDHAKEEVRKVVEDGKKLMAQQHDTMMQQAKADITDLVVAATTAVLGNATDKKVDHAMVARITADTMTETKA